MPGPLNQVKYAALAAQTGQSGIPLNQQEWIWLNTLTAGFGGPMEGMWHKLLDTQGIPVGPLPQRQVATWNAAGYSGGWQEAAYKFWEAGGTFVPAVAPVFTGTIPAQSWTQGVAITPLATASYFGSPSPAPVFTISAGALPAGVTINSASGVISGTPTTITTGSFTVTCTNSAGAASSNSVAWTVAAVVTPAFHALAPNPTTYEMKGILVGSGSMTTVHASVAYALDKDGIYREFLAAEPVWSGGRVVRNNVPFSTDMMNAAWTGSGRVGGKTDPLGGSTAVEITGAGATAINLSPYPYPSKNPVMVSVWLRRVSGTGRILLASTSTVAGVGVVLNVTSTSWKRYAICTWQAYTSAAFYSKFALTIETAGDVIEAAFPQVEQLFNPEAYITAGEQVTNGDFNTDTDWTKSTGWTISGGKANFNGSANQTIFENLPSLQSGRVYRVRFVVESISTGNIKLVFGTDSNLNFSTYNSYVTVSLPGTYDMYVSASSWGVNQVGVASNTSQVVVIDSISILPTTIVPAQEYVPVPGANNVATVYANQNGRTLNADNSVNEIVGAPLAQMPFLQYYPAATNSCLYSNDQTNAWWTKTNITVLKGVAATNAYSFNPFGIDGRDNSCTRLTAIGANGTCIGTAVVAASNSHSACFWLKRITGTGQISVTLDGGTTWNNITLTAAFQKFTILQAALTNPVVGIRMATSGDVIDVGNVGLFLVTTLGVYQMQDFGPIFTTTAAVATNYLEYSFASTAPNFDDVKGAFYIEYGTFHLELSTGANDSERGLTTLSSMSSSSMPGVWHFTRVNGTSWTITATTAGAAPAVGYVNYPTPFNNIHVGVAYEFVTAQSASVKATGGGAWSDGVAGATGWGVGTMVISQANAVAAWPKQMRNLRRYDVTSLAQAKSILDGLLV